MALQTQEESIQEYYDRRTQYEKDLRDPKKFTAIFLGSVYEGKFPHKEMLYAMATERWRGYVLIIVRKYSSTKPKPQIRRKLFMITDTEINELEPANFHWEPARFATDTCRKINEEHGGYADCRIISTTNISDILKGD